MGIAGYLDYMHAVGTKDAGKLVQPDLMKGAGGSTGASPDNGTAYVFSQLAGGESSLLDAISEVAPTLGFVDAERMKGAGPQFYLGAAGTGAPMHYHVDAYNVLVHGTYKTGALDRNARGALLMSLSLLVLSAHLHVPRARTRVRRTRR